jgi:hypothetical protein
LHEAFFIGSHLDDAPAIWPINTIGRTTNDRSRSQGSGK